MARSKSVLFPFEEQLIANFSDAMSHPARVRMMQRLILCDSILYDDLVEDIPLASGTLAQHLRTLERTGYMVKTMHGNVAGYALDRTNYLLSLATMREGLRTDRVLHRRVLVVEDQGGKA